MVKHQRVILSFKQQHKQEVNLGIKHCSVLLTRRVTRAIRADTVSTTCKYMKLSNTEKGKKKKRKNVQTMSD